MSNLRHYVMRALLAALALTALAGAAGVMTSGDTMWRLCGTCLTAAVASLLMLRISALLDKPETRNAGLAGSIGITVEFILVVISIWGAGRRNLGYEEELVATIFIAPIATCAIMVFLRMLATAATRVSACAGLAITVLASGLALTAVWWGSSTGYWRAQENLWVTAITTGALGFLAVGALVGVGADRRHWRWAGVAAAAVAMAYAYVDVWTRSHHEGLLSWLIAAAAWVALAIPTLRLELTPGQRWLRTATLALGGGTALLWAFFGTGRFDSEPLGRAAAACAIPTACGTLALVIITRLKRRVDTAALPRALSTITVYCPRCTKKQTQPLGPSACAGCGLKMELKAEQPACIQCGYLLYGTAVARCPECGTPVTRPALAA